MDAMERIDNAVRDDIARIEAAGYPTAVIRNRDDVDSAYIDWWTDPRSDLFAELTDGIREGHIKMSDASWHRELDEVIAHQNALVDQTLEVLRKTGNVDDLCQLIDDTAEIDSADSPMTGAGSFLRTIAELAMERIQQMESARPAGTGTSAEQNDLFGSDYSSQGGAGNA
ncbi:polysaccharide deacetylase family protein [Thiorhodovibrio frisius]|uniref:Uncharacterized protein n=1 Tax=Thiorhodovibrio frisius TaxID=631362 RepID=H8YXW0_9GAMM|nr:hypothetical protein [Thiorhodovibrio frisius]EIC23286.1 hypothetical protein Thi970DRAFT_00943 [Thiorhodovibrio frisius]WPL23636.1 hypothetical protein Thiofri_03831 [Thiorhodovibrio frisius]